MSKSYQKKKNHKPQAPPANLESMQVDETIVTGSSAQPRHHHSAQLMQSIAELMETMGALNMADIPENFDPDQDDFDIEAFETRLKTILEGNVLRCNQRSLKQYLQYLKTHIKNPCYLTGREDFTWEGEYLFGNGSSQTYERLKQDYASHTDVFKLLQFFNQPSEAEGILVEVQRTSDRKKFTIPLADLEVTSLDSPNYDMVEDYCIWFINYA